MQRLFAVQTKCKGVQDGIPVGETVKIVAICLRAPVQYLTERGLASSSLTSARGSI